MLRAFAAIVVALSCASFARAWEDIEEFGVESFGSSGGQFSAQSFGSSGGYGGYSRSLGQRVFRQEQIIENRVVQEPDQVITRNKVVYRPQIVQEQQVIPGRRYVVPSVRQNFQQFDVAPQEFDVCPPPVQQQFFAPPSRCGRSAYAQGFSGGCGRSSLGLAALGGGRSRGGGGLFGGGLFGGGASRSRSAPSFRGSGIGALALHDGRRDLDFQIEQADTVEFSGGGGRGGLLARILGR